LKNYSIKEHIASLQKKGQKVVFLSLIDKNKGLIPSSPFSWVVEQYKKNKINRNILISITEYKIVLHDALRNEEYLYLLKEKTDFNCEFLVEINIVKDLLLTKKTLTRSVLVDINLKEETLAFYFDKKIKYMLNYKIRPI